ncbi:MAG: DUF47 domain-containing protein [Caulobacteraceae bacterium]
MLQWFQALMPKEDRFFTLFSQHARTLQAGAESLRELLRGGGAVSTWSAKIMEQEEAADAITREVMLAVRRTFITPFDRGDIQDLISLLDDAIDQMQKTAKVITLFEIRTFEPAMEELGELIVQTAKLTVEAVDLLGSMRQNAGRLNALAEEITRIEDMADAVYDRGRKGLFLAHRTDDPMAYIIGVDIYSSLEKVVDRFEDVANRISGIVIEQV